MSNLIYLQDINISANISNNIEASVDIQITEDMAYGYGYGKLNGDFFHVFDINGELDGELLLPTSEIIGNDYWIWKDGANTPDQNATYPNAPYSEGTIGSKWSSCFWTDVYGNFWVFGGVSYGDIGGQSILNDLWKYDISTKKWVWVRKYTSTSTGDYSAGLGNVSPNGPGKRAGATSWTDNNGIFWLFGGFGYGESLSNAGMLNDLWQYNPYTDEWRWMAGSKSVGSSGSYPLSYNQIGVPKARYRACSFTDLNGNLWLFGGNNGLVTTICNDLWKYDINNNQWYFMGGAKGVTDPGMYPANYGEVGYPCSRDEAGFCLDLNGNFWLFGGRAWGAFGNSSYVFGATNDLWKYDTNNNQWYFMGGAKQIDDYTTDYTIPARIGTNMVAATEDSLLLFSGFSSAALPNSSQIFSDFWRYSISNNSWNKIKNSDNSFYPPNHGEEGFPKPRRQAAVWRTDIGNIFMFGGNDINDKNYNDLWEYRVTDKFLYGYGFEYTQNIINQYRNKILTVTITPKDTFNEEFNVILRIIGPGISTSYTKTTVNHIIDFDLSDIKNPVNSTNLIQSVANVITNPTLSQYGYNYKQSDLDYFNVLAYEDYPARSSKFEYITYINDHQLNDKDLFFDVVLEISNLRPLDILKMSSKIEPNLQTYSKQIGLRANITNGQ